MRVRGSLIVVALVGLTTVMPAAQPIPQPQSPIPEPRSPFPEIDAVFSGVDRKDSPGCALGVFKDGAIAYERGYGMASLEHDVPITPKTVFYAGSVSKQFTAMSAALAIQQGKLSYADPIRKYVPELPAYADPITIGHLLHHTSGLRDYNTLLSVTGRRDEEAWDNRVVLQMTARQTALNFTPGDEYLYSNTGYTLLATIVERATGMKFDAFADANIFKPLGMTATHYHVDARRLVPGRALAYAGRDGRWLLDTPINERAGAGGLYTNIPDLLKWDESFYSGRLGGPELLKKMQTQGKLNNGTTLSYAWGLQIGEYRGLSVVEHSGSLGGYRAHLIRFPSQHTSVALLCNSSTIAPSSLARRVADIVVSDRFMAPVPPVGGGVPGSVGRSTAAVLTPATANVYAASFYSEELDATFVITFKDGVVRLQRETDPEPIALEPGVAIDEFRARSLTIRFQRDANQTVTGFTVDAGRVRGITFTKR